MSTQLPGPEIPYRNPENDTDVNMADATEPLRHQGPPVPPKLTSKDSGLSRPGSPLKGSTHEAIDWHRNGHQRFEPGAGTTKILVDRGSQISIEVRPNTRSTSPEKGLMRQPISPLTAVDRTPEAFRFNAPSEELQALQKTLEEERRHRETAENELRKKNIELEDIRKRWKQAASELNKFRVQAQGFYQVTDRYLIDLATQLRYNIRSFAIQYFGGALPNNVKMQNTEFFECYMQPATPGTDAYRVYLRSPGKCPSIVQAFLWRVLASEIFDKFLWAGNISRRVSRLCDLLRPRSQSEANPESRSNPEAERKYQMWSATTTGLLLDTLNMEEGSEAYKRLEKDKNEILEQIQITIDPFVRSCDEGYTQELRRILNDALALDREISRQVARVFWVFGSKKTQLMFDSTTMELEKGEKPSKANQEVLLVVGPAMRKRGKSTGEDFNVENVLLQMEVSCEPVLDMLSSTRHRR